jgi:hypothetical protein
MKINTEERVIKVKVVTFPDGTKVDASVIHKFLEEISYFEDTIGKTGNYTDEYFYFETSAEKEIEDLMIKYKVVRQADYYKKHNREVKKIRENPNASNVAKSWFSNYNYWLGSGYHRFKENFYKEYYAQS